MVDYNLFYNNVMEPNDERPTPKELLFQHNDLCLSFVVVSII